MVLDADGNLTLGPSGPPILLSFIWIANSGDGTVSKIDTKSGQEKARYRTGPGNPDPSRTTVSLEGDAVVANRGGSSAVRINVDPATCPDKNGNGRVDTSTGPQDVLPWGQDECVIWFTQFPTNSLARAAAFDYHMDPNGHASHVWIGLYNTQKVLRLNAQTGAIIDEIGTAGHSPFGLAMDGVGNLWMMEMGAASLVRIDTTTLGWKAVAAPHNCNYGVTVDKLGRIWTAGADCAAVYDPRINQWTKIDVGSSNRGVAVDGAGSVWIADDKFGVHRIDSQTLTVQPGIPISGGGFVGVAVAFDNRIWAVNKRDSRALRIDPATAGFEPFETGNLPYTCGDMTGFQLVLVAPPQGLYHQVFGCGPGATWGALSWEADTPDRTAVKLRIRVGNTREQLLTRSFVQAASQPLDASPQMLEGFISQAFPGDVHAAFLEVEVALTTANAGLKPVLKQLNVECQQHVD